MIASAECLAKADQFDGLASGCVTEKMRDAYIRMAGGWRHTASLAIRQETWLALNPEALSRSGSMLSVAAGAIERPSR